MHSLHHIYGPIGPTTAVLMQRVLFTPRHSHRAGGGESAATRARAATTLAGIVGEDGASAACDLSDDLIPLIGVAAETDSLLAIAASAGGRKGGGVVDGETERGTA